MSQTLPQFPTSVVSYQSFRRVVLSPFRQFVWIVTLVTGSVTIAAALIFDLYLWNLLEGLRNFGFFTALLASIPFLVGLTEILCSFPIRQKSRLATNLAIVAVTLQFMVAAQLFSLGIFATVFSGDSDYFLTHLFITVFFAVIALLFAAIALLLVESRRELPLNVDPCRFTDAQYYADLRRDTNRPPST